MTPAEIEKRLERFEAVPCRLAHEKVRLAPRTRLPVTRRTGDETIYQRNALCPADVRRWRIGCAHSVANGAFCRLLDSLNPDDSVIAEYRREFQELVSSIYALDHDKGEREKDYAICIGRKGFSENEAAQIREAIQKLEEEHVRRVHGLNDLKNAILNRLERLKAGGK